MIAAIKRTRLATGLAAVLVLFCAATATSDDSPAEPADSLDAELLKELEGTGDEPSAEPADTQPGEAEPADPESGDAEPPLDDLDRKLLEGLEGEENAESQEDALTRIVRQMREAETKLAEKSSGDETQGLQKRIVSDLAKLIEELEKNAKAMSSQGSSSSRGQGSRSTKAQQGGEASGAGRQSPNPRPRESSGALRQEKTQQPDLAAREDLLKAVWGSLPEQIKEQMTQYAKEEFLPKYELMIEEYFKRLVEDR